jgi:ABC-type multidrug transport system fused ATPase/permease subunit
MDGLSAARQALDIIEPEPEPEPPRSRLSRTPDPATAEIRLESVTVRHPGRPVPALADVTLTIRPGETVAVAGPSGAGKTTLLHLILGFVRPDSGRVLVGPPDQLVDLLDVDAAEWRRGLGWLPQRHYLIAGTVADNIRLAGASTGDPAAAARLARVDDVVAGLPAGYATQLADRGAGLAAGQRQRLGLARVVYRDAPVVLLDEPTAHLDGRVEAEVLGGLGRFARGRTMVVVSHRPAALAMAGRVVVLDRGRVVADRALQGITR